MATPLQPTPLYRPDVPNVEALCVPSLTSLMAELAADHGIGPRDLVKRVLGDVDPGIRKLGYGSFFDRYALTINGHGSYARLFTEAMRRATGHQELHRLTLLPWQGLLATQGSALIARRRRWCPHCWADMQAHGSTPHDWLLWSFAMLANCPIHGVPLQAACDECNRPQPVIPRLPLLARCDHCGSSLASRVAQSASVVESQPPAVGILADLVCNQPGVAEAEVLPRWRAFLQGAADDLAEGKRAALARLIGLPDSALKNWFLKRERPSLSRLVQVCVALKTTPSSVFATSPTDFESSTRRATKGPALPVSSTTRRESSALPLPTLIPPVGVIAKELNLTRAQLKRLDGEAYESLRRVRSAFRKAESVEIRRLHAAYVHRTVERMLRAGETFGRKRVDAALRDAGFSLRHAGADRAFADAIAMRDARLCPTAPPARRSPPSQRESGEPSLSS